MTYHITSTKSNKNDFDSKPHEHKTLPLRDETFARESSTDTAMTFSYIITIQPSSYHSKTHQLHALEALHKKCNQRRQARWYAKAVGSMPSCLCMRTDTLDGTYHQLAPLLSPGFFTGPSYFVKECPQPHHTHTLSV